MHADSQLNELEEKIGYKFRDVINLIEALTHPSYSAENQKSKRDNQRLEFLGDSVIEIIVTKKLFFLFSDYPEGELTKIRAALSKESTLAQFARKICLGKYLRVGHGEQVSKGYNRNSVLCDAFEALVGAIFVDCDCQLLASSKFINGLVDDSYGKKDMQSLVRTENPKGLLQEWTQKTVNEAPEYKILEEVGPDHQKIFTVGVYINQECLGVGKAGKRQAAEEIAARLALEHVQK